LRIVEWLGHWILALVHWGYVFFMDLWSYDVVSLMLCIEARRLCIGFVYCVDSMVVTVMVLTTVVKNKLSKESIRKEHSSPSTKFLLLYYFFLHLLFFGCVCGCRSHGLDTWFYA